MSAQSADSVDHSRNRATTTAVTAMLLGLLAIALVVAVLYFLFAQQLPELTPERLAEAQAKWAKSGPASYTMDIKLGGTRPGPVHIEIENGEPIAMTRDGITPNQERVWGQWSVPGMFDTIERELELAEDPVNQMDAAQGTKLWLRSEFDPVYGYPRIFHRAVRGGGPEVYWEVTTFEPKP